VLDYLCSTRGWKGGAARSIATSHLIDAVAKKHGIEVYETGVGFKFIGDLLVQGKIIFGGEESGISSIMCRKKRHYCLPPGGRNDSPGKKAG
jgi:phosphoglucomutase